MTPERVIQLIVLIGSCVFAVAAIVNYLYSVCYRPKLLPAYLLLMAAIISAGFFTIAEINLYYSESS